MTLSSDTVMGEQPLLSVKAHVYHIDPKSKKSWIPATTQAVPVSFFFDSPRHLYRVISVEGTKAVINSIVTPHMTVTKTSQKFLQWSDARVNMVYGLGFSREDDLNDFQEKFAHVKSLSQGPNADTEDDASSELGHDSQLSQRSLNASVAGLASNSSNESGLPPNPHMVNQRSVSPGQSSVSSSNSPRPTQSVTSLSQAVTPVMGPQGTAIQMSESQLQVENGRLREALARSCAHADKWRNQIKMLEEEKQKLLRALEESHSNLERWKAEYAHDNRIASENERNGSGDHAADSYSEQERLQTAVQNLEKRNRAKDSEVENLTARLEEMRAKESNQSTMEKLQTTESDNRALKLAISDMQEKLSRQVGINENMKADMRLLKSSLTRQVVDLKKAEDKLGELLTNPSS